MQFRWFAGVVALCVPLLVHCTRFGFEPRVSGDARVVGDLDLRDQATREAGSRDVGGLLDGDSAPADGAAPDAVVDGLVVDAATDSATADARADGPTPDAAGAQTVVALIGVQERTRSNVLRYRVDLSSNSAALEQVHDLTGTPVTTSGLRAFSRSGQELWVGSYLDGNRIWRFDDQMVLRGDLLLSGRPSQELSDLMGLCVLPDGHIIASSFSPQYLAEFDAGGSFVQDVYTTISQMSDCAAIAASEIVIVDQDAYTDESATLRRLRRSPSAGWQQVESFELTTVGGSLRSSAWTLYFDGTDVYVPPLHPGGGGTNRMVRCPSADLSRCVEVGAGFPRTYPSGAVEAIAGIPGSEDLLVADHQFLMRYRADGSIVELAAHNRAQLEWLRKMHIFEP
jgi:hypothetical protein